MEILYCICYSNKTFFLFYYQHLYVVKFKISHGNQWNPSKQIYRLRTITFLIQCNELILLSTRYEIRASSSEDFVFVPPNLYDVTAPRSVVYDVTAP